MSSRYDITAVEMFNRFSPSLLFISSYSQKCSLLTLIYCGDRLELCPFLTLCGISGQAAINWFQGLSACLPPLHHPANGETFCTTRESNTFITLWTIQYSFIPFLSFDNRYWYFVLRGKLPVGPSKMKKQLVFH